MNIFTSWVAQFAVQITKKRRNKSAGARQPTNHHLLTHPLMSVRHIDAWLFFSGLYLERQDVCPER